MTVSSEKVPIVDHKRMRSLGGSARVNHELQEYKKRVRMLAEKRPELERKYPDQWVALTSNGTIVAAHTIREMMKSLANKGLRGNDAAVKFIATTRRRMIL